MVRKMTRTVILSCGERHSVSMVRKMTRTVILSRVDGEGSPNAKTSHFAILRRASPTQDDGRVIRSRPFDSLRSLRASSDGEGSPNAKPSHFAILRRASPTQDDGGVNGSSFAG